ncbi:MAG: metallophosphoesterase family protein [Candidatus Staskawiczbacteria bacterium]|jgi:putative phosphoesterase
MKIAIVSDTHNNWANFKKAIEWIKKEKIQLILHCGDICNQEIIDDAKKSFGGDIKFVKGNADHGLNLPDKIEMEFNGKKIVFCHFPNDAKKLTQSGKYDLVFYGHTHRPWDEKVGECHMINPGELAGQFYKPCFAVYDTTTGKLELKILEKL